MLSVVFLCCATAVALVRPSKSIHDVDVRAVRKKMKDKAFAAKVSREDIICGAEGLGRPLYDVIAGVLVALKAQRGDWGWRAHQHRNDA